MVLINSHFGDRKGSSPPTAPPSPPPPTPPACCLCMALHDICGPEDWYHKWRHSATLVTAADGRICECVNVLHDGSDASTDRRLTDVVQYGSCLIWSTSVCQCSDWCWGLLFTSVCDTKPFLLTSCAFKRLRDSFHWICKKASGAFWGSFFTFENVCVWRASVKHRGVSREKVGEEEEEEEKPTECFITSAADKKEAQWWICESGGQGHRGGAAVVIM